MWGPGRTPAGLHVHTTGLCRAARATGHGGRPRKEGSLPKELSRECGAKCVGSMGGLSTPIWCLYFTHREGAGPGTWGVNRPQPWVS